VKREHEHLLRRLALNEEGALSSTVGPVGVQEELDVLDARTQALVHLAALIALDGAAASYQWAVAAAIAAGSSDDEILGVLAAVAPIVGLARTSAAAPDLALAVGGDESWPQDHLRGRGNTEGGR
jgi:alkylhydroperoxidase/carboxymuconolactone decarboxylase family protein YurZ